MSARQVMNAAACGKCPCPGAGARTASSVRSASRAAIRLSWNCCAMLASLPSRSPDWSWPTNGAARTCETIRHDRVSACNGAHKGAAGGSG